MEPPGSKLDIMQGEPSRTLETSDKDGTASANTATTTTTTTSTSLTPDKNENDQEPTNHPDNDNNNGGDIFKFFSPLLSRCDTDVTDEETMSLFSATETAVSEAAVKFGTVVVREYERVIDSTQIYMGLALGWEYTENEPVPISSSQDDSQDDKGKQETNKGTKRITTTSRNINNGPETPKGNEEEMGGTRMKRTNGSERYGMLLRYGYAQKELRKATDEAAKFYKQRQKEMARDAARSLVVADGRNNSKEKKRKPLFGSMFRR